MGGFGDGGGGYDYNPTSGFIRNQSYDVTQPLLIHNEQLTHRSLHLAIHHISCMVVSNYKTYLLGKKTLYKESKKNNVLLLYLTLFKMSILII